MAEESSYTANESKYTDKSFADHRTASVPTISAIPNSREATEGEISFLAHRPSLSQTWLNRLMGVKAIISEETPNAEEDSDGAGNRMPRSCSSGLNSKPMLDQLLQSNKRWAKRMTDANPRFFETLSKQQNPKIFWIGCSDSRVPANQIVDLAPGEVCKFFVVCDTNCIMPNTLHSCPSQRRKHLS
jgi:hypothetical protein